MIGTRNRLVLLSILAGALAVPSALVAQARELLELQSRLAASDPALRDAAATALAAHGAKALRYVKDALGERDGQLGAIATVGLLGKDGVPLLPAVTKLWRNEDLATSEAIRAACVRLGVLAVPHLTTLVPDHALGIDAARTLGEIGAAATEAVPALIAVLQKGAALSQQSAAEALGEIGDPRAIPTLTRLASKISGVDSHADSVGQSAIASLARFGPAAREAVPVLLDLMTPRPRRPGDSDTRLRVASALAAIGDTSQELVDALRELAKQDGETAAAALDALATLAPDYRVGIDRLRRNAQSHGSVCVRQLAVQELASRSITPEIADALASLAVGPASKKGRDPAVRLAALAALTAAGPAAASAIARIRELTADEDAAVAAAAVEAVKAMGG